MNSFSRAGRAILAVVVLPAVLAATGKALAAEATAEENEIRIVELQGSVEVFPVSATVWAPAQSNQVLHAFDRLRTGTDSRVAFRWSDQSVMAFDASTELEVLPPDSSDAQCGLHLIRGIFSFFHRDKPSRIRVITRGAVAGVEGTEFVMEVNEADRTTLSVIDGMVKFGNDQATLVLTNGQQAFADVGQAPIRTAGFVANNLLQWCFYYPAVLDPADLPLTANEQTALRESLEEYRAGDVLGALAKDPAAPAANSDATRVYRAALLLSVGQVDEAKASLSSLSSTEASGRPQKLAAALRELIAAVERSRNEPLSTPQLATEFLAGSYYEQSQGMPETSLAAALNLARQATVRSPQFGFAWERVAELEFSFGRNEESLKALNKSLELAPRNAEALALKGFLLAAQNRTAEAVVWFDRALAADSALGNAWLGRGLCRIRRGDAAGGREDLLVAAALEPQRSELRSYLGKAYANAGDYARAGKELQLAKKLDPNDPTSWLYSALLKQQNNQINDAIRDLETSEALNENRSVYRSQFLLDQDQAVRSANLARVYQDAGMTDVSMLEASRAVNYDYANYSAHLFLANSFSQLVDPNEISLRYETAMENEFLLANLLSPAAAGAMSQTVSQQEYARLFQRDRAGFISDTEYLSRGAWDERSAQYGIDGDFSYNLEADYHFDPGERTNNDFEQRQFTLTLKQQLTPKDSVYMQVLDYDANGGDIHQYYSPNLANPDFRFQETQEPTVVLGYHHEWRPGVHTLLLLGRINDTYSFTDPNQLVLTAFRPTLLGKLTGVDAITVNEAFENQLTVYSSELQQIFETAEHNTILGGRLQYGDFDTTTFQNMPSMPLAFPTNVPVMQDANSYFQRASLYGYHQWQVLDALQLFGGLTYDWMKFPGNFQTAPVSNQEQTTSRLSPKAGLILTPTKDTTLRFAYTRSLGGTSVDQSYQLEPSQLAGFVQSFRSVIPESVAAESPGAGFETYGISLDQKFSTGTYLELSGEMLNSKVAQDLGAYDFRSLGSVLVSPSGLNDTLVYHEKTLQLTINQLLGEEWSMGAQYRISQAGLKSDFSTISDGLHFMDFQPRQQSQSLLQQSALFVIYNHPGGFFARGEAMWNAQHNAGYTPSLADDDFWQFNAFAGYRFWHRTAELRLGLLNIFAQDYNLNPLNLHEDFPRQRTLSLRLLLNF